jgi:hypothetical protein
VAERGSSAVKTTPEPEEDPGENPLGVLVATPLRRNCGDAKIVDPAVVRFMETLRTCAKQGVEDRGFTRTLL